MKTEQFKAWLSERGVTPKAVNTRAYAVSKVEQNLAALGCDYPDLDAADGAGALDQVLDALRELLDDAKAGGTAYRLLMPQSNAPSRLYGWRSWVSQYGKFRATLALGGEPSDRPALEALRLAFLRRCRDFVSFAQPDGTYVANERAYKDRIVARVAEAIAAGGPDDAVGEAVYQALCPDSGPILRWQTADAVVKEAPNAAPAFHGIIGRAAQSTAPVPEVIAEAARALEALHLDALTHGEVLNIAISVAGIARPREAAPFKISKARALARHLTGQPIFTAPSFEAAEVEAWLTLQHEIFEVMRDRWRWAPTDLLDVQGFGWVALSAEPRPADDADEETDSAEDEDHMPPPPTNLILYGPPGTGKTYRTAEEAVRLCDGKVSTDRTKLMTRYQELVKANQIRFVTFHQSYAYEDFVEGLRPTTANTPDDETAAGGFSLEPRQGIFRSICAAAEQARKSGGAAQSFNLEGRRVYKMSIGRAGLENEIYDAAIAGGYAAIGWGGKVDWSDPKYREYPAVFDKWNEIEPGTSGNSGNISQVWRFRSMRPRDIIVVSDGNLQFRAIGEVTGDYYFEADPGETYHHRRPVKWHVVLDESLPVEEIHGKNFSQTSCYLLDDRLIKREALARLLQKNETAQPAAPDQFVLIIDEINRANISKVFGELITLLEPDKRLGGDNPLTVTLPYSGDSFGVPDNLHIIGTMNTADRSIALLDTALRRRFQFRELMPNPVLLQEASDRTGIDLVSLLTVMNARIEYLFDRDHQIGHALFMGCETREDVNDVMRHKVIPLLAEYFYEDWARVALVLGDAEGGGRFLKRSTLPAPAGLPDDLGESRHRWEVLETFASHCYDGFA